MCVNMFLGCHFWVGLNFFSFSLFSKSLCKEMASELKVTKDKDERPMLHDRPLKQSKVATESCIPAMTLMPAPPGLDPPQLTLPQSEIKTMYDEEEDELPDDLLNESKDMFASTPVTDEPGRSAEEIQGRIFIIGDTHETDFLSFATVLEQTIFNPRYLGETMPPSVVEPTIDSHIAELKRHFTGPALDVFAGLVKAGKTRPRTFFGADPCTVFSTVMPEAIHRAYHVVGVPEHSLNYLRRIASEDFNAELFSLSSSFLDPEDDVPFWFQHEKDDTLKRFKAADTAVTMNKSYGERSRYFLFQSRVTQEARIQKLQQQSKGGVGKSMFAGKTKSPSSSSSRVARTQSSARSKALGPLSESAPEIDALSDIDKLLLDMEKMNFAEAQSVLTNGKFLGAFSADWWTRTHELYVHARDYVEAARVPEDVKYLFVPSERHGWWKLRHDDSGVEVGQATVQVD